MAGEVADKDPAADPAADPAIGDWLAADPSDPGEVSATYDGWVGTYDDDLAAWDYRAPATVIDLLLAHAPDTQHVLDIGCGTGLVGRTLRQRGYEGTLTGLDISRSSLDAAEAHGGYDTLTLADLQQPLPIETGSVDAAVCVGVMTYLPEVEQVWREFSRVVRPGGQLILTQREDLWPARDCPAIVERLESDGVWARSDVTGPSPYLPEGYGDGEPVACYYLVAQIPT